MTGRLLAAIVVVAAALYFRGGSDSNRDRPSPPGDTRIANVQFTLCSRANARTNCVVDGDTIRYEGVAIRVEGIDTPETHEAKCESERALGMRATHRMLELVNEGPFEIVQRGLHDTDRFGRKLRVLERNGRSLGDILIAEGLARRWDGRRRSWCD